LRLWKFEFAVVAAVACSTCVSSGNDSLQVVAAWEVPLPTAADRAAFKEVLSRNVSKSSLLHLDDVKVRWKELEELEERDDGIPVGERGTIFLGVWRGKHDEELIAVADDSGHPSLVWISFLRGKHAALAKNFRESTIKDIEIRWPTARALPVLPGGQLPLFSDLALTSEGYKIKRSAIYHYDLKDDSALLVPK